MKLALLVLVGSVFVVVGQAAAQEEVSDAELAEARHSFEVATLAFENGDYEGAALEFTAAYEITHHPDLLFNIYLAQERAGRLAEARTALEAYLAQGDPAPEQSSILQRRLGRLEARIAAEEASPDVALAPGPAMPDEAQMLAMLRDAAQTLTAPAARVDVGPSWAAVGTLIAAGALGLSFGIFAALSEVEDQALASRCGRDAGGFCTARDVETLSIYNAVADASWIGALTLAVAGTVFAFALPQEQADAPSAAAALRFAPWASASSAGLATAGSF